MPPLGDERLYSVPRLPQGKPVPSISARDGMQEEVASSRRHSSAVLTTSSSEIRPSQTQTAFSDIPWPASALLQKGSGRRFDMAEAESDERSQQPLKQK
jgi:hypothetical protein